MQLSNVIDISFIKDNKTVLRRLSEKKDVAVHH